MRAAVLHEFGTADCLHLEEVADPIPTAGETIVRLYAAALNWHDVLVRQGRYGSPLPHIPGADGAGIRTDTGDEVVIVPSLAWGDDDAAPSPRWEILGDHRPGTYAELVRVPSECLVPKPVGWTWEQAAALPLVGVTTYRALFRRARLSAGESLLVLGAGGGVATMAITLAVAAGVSVVVTSSSAHKLARARELGAVGGALYSDPGWVDAVRGYTSDGFDVVLDPVGNWSPALQALRPGGRLVVLGASRDDQAVLDVRRFYFGQFDLLGTAMGSLRDFAGLLGLIESRTVPPPLVDRAFALSEVATAHRYLESGTGFGKVVLRIGGNDTTKGRIR